MTASPIELPDSVMYGVSNAISAYTQPMLDGFEVAFRQLLPGAAAWIDGYLQTDRHPLASTFPLANPYYALCVFSLYFVGLLVFFVIGKIVGKREMKTYGIVHNFVLTLWSLYMAVGVAWEAYNQGFTFWGNYVGDSPAAYSMAKFCWLFMISKVPEFADTYIMLLKQNYRQISFLHVFHHSSIVVVFATVCNIAPGGDTYFSVFQNSAVHVVMYLYYLLNMVFSDTSAVRKFLQKNKFCITYLQLLQFLLNFIQTIYNLFIAEETYSRDSMVINFVYMIMMMGLFGNFLIRGKMERKKLQKQKQQQKSGGAAVSDDKKTKRH
mmetsp:Transcript_32785/g.38018  ORF Transcript_32785/g.38018 Transcript_32785/m.38018 type:complete len:323 (-) Transcript_32785:106-1074(-)